MKPTKDTMGVAIYARASTARQAEGGTTASQVEALRRRAADDGCAPDDELCFLDDGCPGDTLLRPQLERLRDQAAAGAVGRLYVLAPDRLARSYALQLVLMEELAGAGVEAVFANRPVGRTPEDTLLLQVPGVIAEYERAKITERCRRGRLFAARQGRPEALAAAPYGYRYVTKAEGGGRARYEVVPEEARVVRQLFARVAQGRLTLREVCRRLARPGVPSPTGRPRWRPPVVAHLLANPAYRGEASWPRTRGTGRRRRGPRRRGRPSEVLRQPAREATPPAERHTIPVPALVAEGLFAAAAEQLAESRRRARARQAGARHLLPGRVVCAACGRAPVGWGRWMGLAGGQRRRYVYYQCGRRWERGGDGGRLCRERPLPAAALEGAVWQDVCRLLRDPGRPAEGYERRRGEGAGAAAEAAGLLARRLAAAKKVIARLIDSYADGLLGREEFEPRLQGRGRGGRGWGRRRGRRRTRRRAGRSCGWRSAAGRILRGG